jgi:predicted transcriptional regulator
MNNVRHLLKVKGSVVWTITQNATVFDGMRMMAEKNIGALVVMNGSKPAGIC